MKRLKILMAAIAIASLSISSVFAGNFGMGVTVSAMGVEADGTETDTLTVGGADVADTSVRKKSTDANTTVGSLYGEYTFDARIPLTLGFEYTPGTANVSDKLSRTDTETSQVGNEASTTQASVRTAAANATNFNTVYAELPLFSGFYVRGGVSSIDIDYTTTTTSAAGGSYDDTLSLTGMNLGFGYKGTVGSFNYKAAYETTDYDSFSLRSTSAVAGESNLIKGDLDTSAIRLSLGKSF